MKCSNCEKNINKIKVESISATDANGKTLRSIAYCCPHCSTIISVQVDPYALIDEIKKIRR